MRISFSRFSRVSMALVCGGFSACVLALCVFGGIHFKRGIEQELFRETGNIARILMASFDEDASQADAILMRLAAQIPESDVSGAREAELHELLARYALQSWMIGPGVLDRNGVTIASALTDSIPKLSLGDRSVFRFHIENPDKSQLYISTPTRGLFTQEWSIQFSRPLRNSSGALYGVMLASYRLSHFTEIYEKLKLSSRGFAGLTGKDGIVRIRSLSGVIGYGTSVPKIGLVFDRVLAGEKAGTFYGRSGLDDVTRIGTFVASQTTPFYVTVGYDADYLRSRYIGFFYALGLCWFLLTAAMIAAAAIIRRMEKIEQSTQLEIVNSAIAERQKISADMHDSIGASLAALLAHFTTDDIDIAAVKRRIGEILMELRFLVDSTEPVDGELGIVLGNVRHRMESGIELAGINFRWRAGDLPKIPQMTARDTLAIKLILMEALSNVLHHSKAKIVTVTASFDEQASRVSITVEDDGCGFNAGDETKAGRGIANMRKRIRAISTGGALVIQSAPGRGTTVRVELTVPPDSGAAA